MLGSAFCKPGSLYAVVVVADAPKWAFYLALTSTTGHIFSCDRPSCDPTFIEDLDFPSSDQGYRYILTPVGRAPLPQSFVASPVCFASVLEHEHVVLDNIIKPCLNQLVLDDIGEKEMWIAIMRTLHEDGTYTTCADIVGLADRLEQDAVKRYENDGSLVINDELAEGCMYGKAVL